MRLVKIITQADVDRPRSRRTLLVRTAVLVFMLPILAIVSFSVTSYFFPFPIDRLKRRPQSPRVTDRAQREILAITGTDEQWRFPIPLERMNPQLIQATIAAEDERFFQHCGVDPVALLRAICQDISAGKVVSGGSTLTMQVCRMMDNRPRTWQSKIIEMFRSLQLERIYDKNQILETYLNMAPYGRNLRGVQAAAWTWFGKPAADLSLGEAALLAGLPQSPSRYRPDRFAARACLRRETVLRRMVEQKLIDRHQQEVADGEPVIIPYRRKPVQATHAGWLALHRRSSGGQTTLDPHVQAEMERLVQGHVRTLPAGVDIAAVVIEIASGDILAMVGSADAKNPSVGQVNGVIAWRSPGSALKPFLYAAAFEARRLAPDSILYDIPIYRGGWSPANFDRTFSGQIRAADALRKSRNVPAILVAEGTGLSRCVGLIQAAGVMLPPGTTHRSGLSVAVGGTEVRLLDLTNGYATLGRRGTWQQPRLFLDDATQTRSVLDPNVCAAIDEILSSRGRCPAGMEALAAHDIPWFMWKTGTSSGRRDAWAVGHNRKVAVGIWVGRFSGLGDAELTGAKAAEPLLARAFDLPMLRTEGPSAPVRLWLVARPLPGPLEQSSRPAILLPSNGSTFIAAGGEAVICPRLDRPFAVTWFLNGMRLADTAAERLVLPQGRYELRCVDGTGVAAAVNFTIR